MATQSPSEAVLAVVAERTGVSPAELRPPLYEAINPEALDTLFRESPGEVTFEYNGYVITVDHESTVEVTAASE